MSGRILPGMHRLRLAAAIFALTALALPLSACSASSEPASARQPKPASASVASAATPSPSSPSPAPNPSPAMNDPVLLAFGDVGTCTGTADEAVAALAASLPGAIAIAGDVAYETGSASDFANCFDPAWSALKPRIHPAPGNHDYGQPGARGYFTYFGEAAGDAGKGYYSFDVGAWHIISLNSNCQFVPGGCAPGSPQVEWLAADLAAHPGVCTLAFWHHPRFTSGLHGDTVEMQTIWATLARAHAAIVVSGHDHHYERFAPLDGDGQPAAGGIREFIAGTGGAQLYPVLAVHAGSEVRSTSTHGLLKLTLHPHGYDWEFIPVAPGTFRDSGSGTCAGSGP